MLLHATIRYYFINSGNNPFIVLLGGSVVVVVLVVVDTGVNVVVLTGNIIFCPLLFPLFLLLFQGFDGYLGAIVGIIGVGGKVPNSQLFTVVPHLSGLGLQRKMNNYCSCKTKNRGEKNLLHDCEQTKKDNRNQ